MLYICCTSNRVWLVLCVWETSMGGFSTSRLYFPNWGRIRFPFCRRDFFFASGFVLPPGLSWSFRRDFLFEGTGKHFERMCTFQLNAPCLGGFHSRLLKGLFGLYLCYGFRESIQKWYFQVVDSNKPPHSLPHQVGSSTSVLLQRADHHRRSPYLDVHGLLLSGVQHSGRSGITHGQLDLPGSPDHRDGNFEKVRI